MARTRWPPGPETPRPLAQARQIRPAPPVGATKPGARPTNRSQDSPSGAGRFGGQAGTQAPDPTPAPAQNHGSRAGAGSTTHILPADSLLLDALDPCRRVECLS